MGRGHKYRCYIDLDQDFKIRYWTWQLHCTETELRQAVQKVGNSPSAVERLLTGSRFDSTPPPEGMSRP